MSQNQPPPRRRRFGGCVARAGLLVALGALIVFLLADPVFQLRSNLCALAFRDSPAPLEIWHRARGWDSVFNLSPGELREAMVRQSQATGLTWSVLKVRRHPQGLEQRLVAGLFDMEVNVIELDPARFEFVTTFRENFAPTTARERLDAGGLAFAITANFRDPKDRPLGLVVRDGEQRNPSFPNWTGYFFVKDGRPWFGPRSLFDETPGILTEASQGYPSIMRNHTVFPYVDLQPNRFFDGHKITYRALAGVRQNGTVIFILSGTGGIMNVAEVAALAQKLNVQHATLLDGGRALQYAMRGAGRDLAFAAFNTWLQVPWRELKPQRSPVFIGARARPAGSLPLPPPPATSPAHPPEPPAAR